MVNENDLHSIELYFQIEMYDQNRKKWLLKFPFQFKAHIFDSNRAVKNRLSKVMKMHINFSA